MLMTTPTRMWTETTYTVFVERDVTRVTPRRQTARCRLALPAAPAARVRAFIRTARSRCPLAAPWRRSLSFLSKKSWHTTNLKNVEKVWLAEQEQQKEEQKLERWKKEREDERQQAELRSLQDEMTKTCACPPTHLHLRLHFHRLHHVLLLLLLRRRHLSLHLSSSCRLSRPRVTLAVAPPPPHCWPLASQEEGDTRRFLVRAASDERARVPAREGRRGEA